MEQIGHYLLKIVAVALLCGIVNALYNKSPFSKEIHLMLGLLLTIVVIKPIASISLDGIDTDRIAFRLEADSFIEQGTSIAGIAKDELIIRHLKSYIQGKAESLGATLDFSFQLDQGVPYAVSIEGNAPPYAKTQLTAWISSELGIPKEAQLWN